MKHVRFIVLTIVAISLLTGCGRSGAKIVGKITSHEQNQQPEYKPLPEIELTEEQQLEQDLEGLTKLKIGVSIDNIIITENATSGYDAGMELSFIGKVSAETVQDVLIKYTEEFAEKANRLEQLEKLTITWQLDHLKEGEPIVKAELEKTNDLLEFVTFWFDEEVFVE